jgi:transcriptional regulator with XRE-family HTH domain
MSRLYKNIMQTFGLRLKEARMAAGFRSAQEAALRLGIEPHTYRMYERGDREADYQALIRICSLFGVTANDLLPVPASRNHSIKSDSRTADADV